MTSFKGKVNIGQTYLDTWGREHKIMGNVILQKGWGSAPDVLDKQSVWSLSGVHFNVNTGNDEWGTCLVQLPLGEEKEFWVNRLKLIESKNSKDKLLLIKEDLDRIRQRIQDINAELSNQRMTKQIVLS